MKYPLHFRKLIDALRRLPGVGNRSAERFAFEILSWTPEEIRNIASIIHDVPLLLRHCDICGSLFDQVCPFCEETRLENKTICVVASPKDVFSIEQTLEFKGTYQVLGGLLSPMDGFGPEKLRIGTLLERIEKHQIREVVIALDSTLEGDATALYLKRELDHKGLQITRLAFGLPMGSSLDYVDGGTLAKALSTRTPF